MASRIQTLEVDGGKLSASLPAGKAHPMANEHGALHMVWTWWRSEESLPCLENEPRSPRQQPVFVTPMTTTSNAKACLPTER